MKKILLLTLPCLCSLPMFGQSEIFDRNGNLVSFTAPSSEKMELSTRASSWKSLGEGTFVESFYDYVDYYFSEFLDEDSKPIPVGEELTVEFEENIDSPGVYRLVNPYKNWSGRNSADFSYDSLHDYYILINATNPDYVYLMRGESGITAGGTMTVLHSNIEQFVNMYGMDFMLEYYTEGGGKLIDGVITLPVIIDLNETYNMWINAVNIYGTSCPANATGHLEFVLPQSEENSVAVVESSDAPVEFYSLDGVKVANPERGIYIKRQGDKVTKVLL